jgi:Uma2 family endonuclease
VKNAIPVEKLLRDADSIGVRLEIIDGLPVWEASPVYFHQAEIDRIRSSIHALESSECTCQHVADVYFRFKDGSLKRPDIAVLSRTPLLEEMFDPLTQVPEAVIEVISEGYEDKDMRIAPGFYLTQGVKDVLIFDPRAKLIWHHRVDGVHRHNSPQAFSLECGCECVI